MLGADLRMAEMAGPDMGMGHHNHGPAVAIMGHDRPGHRPSGAAAQFSARARFLILISLTGPHHHPHPCPRSVLSAHGTVTHPILISLLSSVFILLEDDNRLREEMTN